MAVPSLLRSLLLAAPLLAGVDALPGKKKKPCVPKPPSSAVTIESTTVIATTSPATTFPSIPTTGFSNVSSSASSHVYSPPTLSSAVLVSLWTTTSTTAKQPTTTDAPATTKKPSTTETSTSPASSTSAAPHKSTWTNPLFKGWYADPDVIKFGDTYWVYSTTSAGARNDAIDAFSSKDLSTWTKHVAVFKSEDSKWARKHFWAPSVVKRGDTYYLYYSANNDLQNDPSPHGMGVASAKSPAGPFKDITETALIDKKINGATQIDQMIFHDDDGKDYYMWGNGICNIVPLEKDMKTFGKWSDGEQFKNITPPESKDGKYFEGSYMIKRNGWYYLMWSENPYWDTRYLVAYGKSKSLLGPFERIGTILVTDEKTAKSVGHHAMLKDGNDWWIFYHGREMNEENRVRRTIRMDRLYFNEDGTIKPVVLTKGGEL